MATMTRRSFLLGGSALAGLTVMPPPLRAPASPRVITFAEFAASATPEQIAGVFDAISYDDFPLVFRDVLRRVAFRRSLPAEMPDPRPSAKVINLRTHVFMRTMQSLGARLRALGYGPALKQLAGQLAAGVDLNAPPEQVIDDLIAQQRRKLAPPSRRRRDTSPPPHIKTFYGRP